MPGLAIGLGIVGIGALVTSFIFNELTEEEKAKQDKLYSDYDKYSHKKEEEINNIISSYNITKTEFYRSSDERISSLRERYTNSIKNETLLFIENVERNIEEQLELKQEIIDEIKNGIIRLKRMKGNQTTSLRKEAMESLERELYEALNKAQAYISYAKGYKSYLYPYKKGYREIDGNFKMMSFLLPDEYPYAGKLFYREKEYLLEESISECIDDVVMVNYNFNEEDVINNLDEKALVPVLVSSSTFNKSNYTMEYTLSASKGYLKDIAINQNRIGLEAKVKQYKKMDNGNMVIVLDYKGLELYLYRRDLENPKRTPPGGAILRVYPKRWTCDLRFNVEVSEKFQDSLKSFQFDTLPVTMTEEQGEAFIKYIEDNKVDITSNEWKIGPYKEHTIPNVKRFKFQLGNEIVFSVVIDNEEKPTFKFQDILSKEDFFAPQDIFVVMEATLSVAYEDEIDEFDEENFDNIQNLSIMLINEFKVQKALKTSHKGMTYFNKWAEINDKLIHYLEKGKYISCEVDKFRFVKRDKKSGIPIYKGNVKNIDIVRTYLSSVLEGYFTEFFVENSKGEYVLVEFNTTGEEISVYTDDAELFSSNMINVFVKLFPYPVVQQNRALRDFRSGLLTNCKLQSYILDSSNIESNKGDEEVKELYNKRLEKNMPQSQAVIKAVEENEIFMIQGPPGTGKTTVIREIIMQHLEKHINDRILIVSQANVAIDNVLKGIPKEFYSSIIRCGKDEKIDEELKEISFENKYNLYTNKINSKESISNEIALRMWKNIINKESGKYNSVVGELLLKSHNIIGATCVGLAQKQIGLDKLEFDLVIIDEIGKALPSEILIPLIRAKKIIMIGDHKQLPPTINPIIFDEEKIELQDMDYCKDELFEKCLFENLYEKCPDTNKAILRTQYRMPAVIGTMVSDFFYDGMLENGDITYCKEPVYFKNNLNILDMSKDRSFREIKEGNSPIINIREAEVVYDVLKSIREKVGIDKKIAVISPYKRQKSKINNYLKEKGMNIFNENIAINTIDAFQGEEAEIVIYCTTRAIKQTKYFSDLARLNVAFSRAKNELLIIGSLKYFRSYGENHILNKIANYIKSYGEVIEYQGNNTIDNIIYRDSRHMSHKINNMAKKEVAAININEELEMDFKRKEKMLIEGKKVKNYIEIDKIIIQQSFKGIPSNRKKIDHAIEYILKFKQFENPIVVDQNYILLNGYARYLAAKELRIAVVEVTLNDREKKLEKEEMKNVW